MTLLALTACADVQHPMAPERLDVNAQVTSEGEMAWFISTPPRIAAIGKTYQVVAEGITGPPLLSTFYESCELSDETMSGRQTTATVTFHAAGTCHLEALDPGDVYILFPASQVFDVVGPPIPRRPR